jgi:hypothetical protein
MSPADYWPNAGDLVWTDFDPTLGRRSPRFARDEDAGRRPALVVSPSAFTRNSAFAFARVSAAKQGSERPRRQKLTAQYAVLSELGPPARPVRDGNSQPCLDPGLAALVGQTRAPNQAPTHAADIA